MCIYSQIGEYIMVRIKYEREKLGYNQTEFALKLDIANNTLANWENGKRTPSIEKLKEMADLFDCSIDYLVERTDNRNASVIEEVIDNKNIKIEINKDYYATLTPADVKKMLEDLKAVGFDLNKLI